MKRDVSPRQSGAPLAASGCVDVGLLLFFFFLVSDLIRSLHVSPLRPLCGAGGRVDELGCGGSSSSSSSRCGGDSRRDLLFFFFVGMEKRRLM